MYNLVILYMWLGDYVMFQHLYIIFSFQCIFISVRSLTVDSDYVPFTI